MDIPLCPHARPAWHYCPNCPRQDIQQPLQIEMPRWEPEEIPLEEKPASTIVVIDI